MSTLQSKSVLSSLNSHV